MSALLNVGEVDYPDYPKRKKRALLVESISKNDFLRKQIIIEDKKQIIKKWARRFGGLDNKVKANAAELYMSSFRELLNNQNRELLNNQND